MRILLAGDSLLAGSLGQSWAGLMGKSPEMTGLSLVNRAVNGITLSGTLSVLKAERLLGTVAEGVIVSAGANDLLFPYMQALGLDWDPFIRKMARHGSVPAAWAGEFETLLGRLAAEAALWNCPVFCCTIPCLGENLKSPLNRQREVYNSMIRNLCRRGRHLYCMDGARSFEAALGPFQPGSSWLFRLPGDLTGDSIILHRKEAEEGLCRERGLRLTIDGAHLNYKGAALLAELGVSTLKEAGLIAPGAEGEIPSGSPAAGTKPEAGA